MKKNEKKNEKKMEKKWKSACENYLIVFLNTISLIPNMFLHVNTDYCFLSGNSYDRYK